MASRRSNSKRAPLTEAPKIDELLSVVQAIRERVRGATPAWQQEWAGLEEDVRNARRAIEMSRWGHGRIGTEVDDLTRRCRLFYQRLCEECPSWPPPV